MNNDKLAEFLSKHKYNCENFNEEGNYDPNPYWLADEIVEFLNLHIVSQQRELLKAYDSYVEKNHEWFTGTAIHTKDAFLKAFNCG